MNEQINKENLGAGATAAEDQEVILNSEKPYIWGAALATLKLEETLSLKPKGWYEITYSDGAIQLVVHRPGHPPESTLCRSPGIANQMRQKLSDQGMAGLIEVAP